MPAGHGMRARTRDLFSRGFRQKGFIPLTTYLRSYKVGDYVDVKVNSAVHNGMPFKYYHDKTGKIWNVTKRSVGVEVNKQVGGRIIKKRIHVRIEHVKPSRCHEDFLERRKRNDQLKEQARKEQLALEQTRLYRSAQAEAKKRGESLHVRRQPAGPKPGFLVEKATIETVTPIPYDVVNDLKGGY